jgi:hypothetical protein
MRVLSKILAAGLLLALAACVSSRPAVQEVMLSQEMASPTAMPGIADGLVPLESRVRRRPSRAGANPPGRRSRSRSGWARAGARTSGRRSASSA